MNFGPEKSIPVNLLFINEKKKREIEEKTRTSTQALTCASTYSYLFSLPLTSLLIFLPTLFSFIFVEEK